MASLNISTKISQIEENLIKIDILIKNSTPELFGIAFHLKIKGTAQWKLKKYEYGEIFKGSKENPFMLISERKTPAQEIIFGISSKKGNTLNIHDGHIASFYIDYPKKETIELEFTNGIVSTFEKERINMEKVIWKNSNFKIQTLGEKITEPENHEIEKEKETIHPFKKTGFNISNDSRSDVAQMTNAITLENNELWLLSGILLLSISIIIIFIPGKKTIIEKIKTGLKLFLNLK